MVLFMLFLWRIVISASKAPLEVPQFGYTGHSIVDVVEDFTLDVKAEDTPFVENEIGYLWTRVTCDIRLDVKGVRTDASGEQVMPFHTDLPPDQTRTTSVIMTNATTGETHVIEGQNIYRIMYFSYNDCLNYSMIDPCVFRVFIIVPNPLEFGRCEFTFKVERGKSLVFDEVTSYSEEGAQPYESFSQLYALIPEHAGNFPLYVKLETPSDDSRIVLQHSWGYSTTVFQSYHDGSFEVQIPLIERLYNRGDRFFVWIAVLDSEPYDLSLGPAKDPDENWLMMHVSPMKLFYVFLILLVVACCLYKLIPSPVVEIPYPDNVPPPVTQEELKEIELITWKGTEDTDKLAKCTICLEEFTEEDKLRKLPCSHCFHKACVDHWLLKSQRRCPLCMQDVGEAVNYHERNESSSHSYFTYVEQEMIMKE